MSNEDEYRKELTELGISDRGADVSMVMWENNKKRYVMQEDDDHMEFVEVRICHCTCVHVCGLLIDNFYKLCWPLLG